jgi:ubiquinone/menaquinone biosynthesis C-methylase UbiE
MTTVNVIGKANARCAYLTESKARDRCLEIAAIQDGESVLEVAVGTGLAFERILKANPSGRNEGIDLTEAMLNRAEKRAASAGFRTTISMS